MKENSIEEDIKILEEMIENANIENMDMNNCFGGEHIEAIEHILSDYKRVLKENEELKQDRNNNYQMIVLAQNDMLNYQAGFEDGKNGRTSAVQSIIENQQYYIFQKQIEKYERHIEKLQKENEEWQKAYQEEKDKQFELIQNTNNTIKTAVIAIEDLQKKLKEVIPVQKVKDKIEEILNNGEYRIIFEGDAEFPDEATCIDAQKYIKLEKLQELLEGRK